MKTVIMYDTDFACEADWMNFLDQLGVEMHEVVDGKIVSRNLTRVEFNVTVAEASAD